MAAPGGKLSAIDLNLLVVFDALMQERNVTRAAKRLALSQPALSHALGRLRHMLKDELFVRSPKGMMPTPRAEALALPVRRALDELRHSLEPPQFDAAVADRNFRIAVDNYSAIVVAPTLASRVTKIAPNVTLDFPPSNNLNVVDLLDRGQLDLAIGPSIDDAERFSRQVLLNDEFVVLLRRGHPAAKAAELDIETFAALPFLQISSSNIATEFVDAVLARRKLKRRIVMRVPFLSAVRILTVYDGAAVISRRVARELSSYRAMVLRPLPFPSPRLATAMTWPRRLDNQPAHRWLRQTVEQAVTALPSD